MSYFLDIGLSVTFHNNFMLDVRSVSVAEDETEFSHFNYLPTRFECGPRLMIRRGPNMGEERQTKQGRENDKPA